MSNSIMFIIKMPSMVACWMNDFFYGNHAKNKNQKKKKLWTENAVGSHVGIKEVANEEAEGEAHTGPVYGDHSRRSRSTEARIDRG